MGDPRKTRKTFDTPRHPWNGPRIIEERALTRAYGTKNKKEIYKMTSALKRFKDQAKSLASRTDEQGRIENEQMMQKMTGLGLIGAGSGLDDILSLSINDLMNRRLQTVMVKKLLARSVGQARQLITHGHVMIGSKVITSPSYLVKTSEEAQITFRPGSALMSESHPERFSEAELEAQSERARAKEAKQSGDEGEEAPPTFAEEDLQDPEELGKEKLAEKEAVVVPEVKPETEATKAEAKGEEPKEAEKKVEATSESTDEKKEAKE